MVTLDELNFATIRVFVRQNDFKPITISKDELENKIGHIIATKKDNNDGTITITFEEDK